MDVCSLQWLSTLVVLVPHFFWFHVEAASQPRFDKGHPKIWQDDPGWKNKQPHSWNTVHYIFRGKTHTSIARKQHQNSTCIIRPFSRCWLYCAKLHEVACLYSPWYLKTRKLIAPKAQTPNLFWCLKRSRFFRKYPSYPEIVWYKSKVP